MKGRLLGRGALLAIAALGLFLWKGGLGLFPVERDLVWKVPGDFASVRRVELQLYREEALLGREELLTPRGLAADPTQKRVLAAGEYQARLLVWREGVEAPAASQARVVVGEATAVVIAAVPR